MKLTIELVPATSWYNNLRKILSASTWNRLRKEVYKNAGYKCEICGGKGKKWPVECHEIWKYDDVNKIQSLEGLIALCPRCHMVKHIGLAQLQGNFELAISHLAKINGFKKLDDATRYVEKACKQYHERSRYQWTIISNIDGIELPKQQ